MSNVSNANNGPHLRSLKGSSNGLIRNNNKSPLDGVKTLEQTLTRENKQKSIYDNVDNKWLFTVAFVRLLAFIAWTGGIIYATYHVYLAAEELLPFNGIPEMNPGPFTTLLNRGRDVSDFEWVTFAPILWTNLALAFLAHLILAKFCFVINLNRVTPFISLGISFVLLWNLMGFLPLCLMTTIPVTYWLMMRLRQKFLIWGATIFFILYLSSEFVKVLFSDTEQSHQCLYFFVVSFAWNLSRSISFCMDMWDRPNQEKFSWESLILFMRYMFYLPLVVTGPLVTYEHFEKEIILNCSNSTNKHNLMNLGKSMLRMFLITILNELIYHYLYFNPLSSAATIYHMNIWAICGTVYWLGQIFTLKYKVMYGIPSCLAEYDGLQMYPLPRCPAYIHRYSVLWKDFDRGLYTFIVKYIYSPLIKTFNTWEPNNRIPIEIKKLVASFITFVYVFVWHSIAFDVFVWAAFNFLGITIERIGSLLKRKMDSVQNIPPLIWDFVVEPIVTVPLAAMSILNSSVFCGSYEAAVSFYYKLLATCTVQYNYHVWIACFLYFFTHVGVTVRTWIPFSKIIKARLSQLHRTQYFAHLD